MLIGAVRIESLHFIADEFLDLTVLAAPRQDQRWLIGVAFNLSKRKAQIDSVSATLRRGLGICAIKSMILILV
jgi:hypothetical protein